MTIIQSNIAELKKILNEPNFKLDEAIEFLEYIEKNVEELNDKITYLENDIDEKRDEISALENPDNFEAACDSTINCGIGEINYESPNNLLLQEMMENLDAAVQKLTPKKVSDILSQLV